MDVLFMRLRVISNAQLKAWMVTESQLDFQYILQAGDVLIHRGVEH
jgi:hypothetical protein